MKRLLLASQPFDYPRPQWTQQGLWPARWISGQAEANPTTAEPVVVAYRLQFELEKTVDLCLHVSADERYELFLDGQLIGRGPERGDENNWFFESYAGDVAPGPHTLVARVWSLFGKSAYAQMSVAHGFLLCPQCDDLVPVLATGVAPWSAKVLGGYDWRSSVCAWGTGWKQIVRGAEFDWDHETGGGEGWTAPTLGALGARTNSQQEVGAHHRLLPAMLPPMLDEPRELGTVKYVAPFDDRPITTTQILLSESHTSEVGGWQSLLTGGQELRIPPHTMRRVIVDLEDYYCARPELAVSGGAGSRVDIEWAEGLFEDTQTWAKGSRDEVDGKYFCAHYNLELALGDSFHPDGGAERTFSTLWWQAGRYVQVLVETGEQELVLHSLTWRETRYPLENEGKFTSSDDSLAAITPIMVRGLQMCSHETYMDCPYFEQLMYVGDTRLEVLVTYAISTDDKLPKKALKLFDWSRQLNGLTQSRYPSRVRQIIPPFSLWWVAMCHDYALWRGDPEFTRSLLPGVRAVTDYFSGLVNEQGLMTAPDGWNFTDWVPGAGPADTLVGKWEGGVPPEGMRGISGVLNWQYALVLKQAGELEAWFGEPEMAQLQTRRASEVAAATNAAFWDEERGLYADDLDHTWFSEHAQCLALLSGFVPADRVERVRQGLLNTPGLARTTIYFTHYLFETYQQMGALDKFFERLNLWSGLAKDGLKTTIEMPEPTRSDCHAWGAHPLLHFYTTLAGIRPVGPGFAKASINPQPGHLEWFEAELPHPKGKIKVSLRDGQTKVELPEGVERV